MHSTELHFNVTVVARHVTDGPVAIYIPSLRDRILEGIEIARREVGLFDANDSVVAQEVRVAHAPDPWPVISNGVITPAKLAPLVAAPLSVASTDALANALNTRGIQRATLVQCTDYRAIANELFDTLLCAQARLRNRDALQADRDKMADECAELLDRVEAEVKDK